MRRPKSKLARLVYASLGGLGLGAGLMYFFESRDPQKNRGRRRASGDRTLLLTRRAGVLLRRRVARASNRTVDVTLELVERMKQRIVPHTVPDEVLTARVRARVDHAVRSPERVTVSASQGYVTLLGHVEDDEILPLCRAVASVPGVSYVENRCAGHHDATG